MKLILVESPTKAKTLNKFLGKDYQVEATKGHVRDLPRKSLGVDIEKDFEPKYMVMPGKRKIINKLKELNKLSEHILLAMDPDREGEAIAWHMAKALALKNPKRIVFHEITKSAIEKALRSPKEIDMKLVDAQQARRVLDRIVGYKLSPFLWKKIARGLSAGRVQSVAVRLVAQREKEIKDFIPQEYWTITALLKKEKELEALLVNIDKKALKKLDIKTKKEADVLTKDLEGADYRILEVEKKEKKKNPFPPFTTSSLQQAAWRKLRFPAKFTMSTAQALYERGFITYHRSDSFNLSQEALKGAKDFILKEYGNKYWPGFSRTYKTKSKTAQEAHEAIRPTYPDKTPIILEKEKISEAQLKLYHLIWSRFISCQMSPAIFDAVRADIEASPKKEEFTSGNKKYLLKSTGQTLRFDGFLKVYPIRFKETTLPELENRETLELIKIIPSQHFTQPLPRYTEASLIKTLEENGIGRPSTYAPIISTIQGRNYIEKDEQKRFIPTEIGKAVDEILVNHFPNVVDIGFTAEMEKELDEIAKGNKEWRQAIKDFYKPFEKNLKSKEKSVPGKKEKYEKTDKKCPECEAPLVIKLGRYGKFYACSNFPKCKYTAPLEKDRMGIPCPKCNKGQIAEKRTRKGKVFYGCNNWPKCDLATWYPPTGEICPKCGNLIIKTKRGFVRCSNKDCDFRKDKD